MLRISLAYHVSKETVLQRLRNYKEIQETIQERKLSYFGEIRHILLQLIMQGKVEDRRSPERRRISCLHNPRQELSQLTFFDFQ